MSNGDVHETSRRQYNRLRWYSCSVSANSRIALTRLFTILCPRETDGLGLLARRRRGWRLLESHDLNQMAPGVGRVAGLGHAQIADGARLKLAGWWHCHVKGYEPRLAPCCSCHCPQTVPLPLAPCTSLSRITLARTAALDMLSLPLDSSSSNFFPRKRAIQS